MRPVRFWLPLLIFFVLASPGVAQTLDTSVDVALSGTALDVDIVVDGRERSTPLLVEVRLDDTLIGKREVSNGSSTLTFEDVDLSAGTHEVEVRSGTLVSTTSFHVLPGWLSLLPPLIAIALALITRNVLVSLTLGIFGGALIVNGWDPFTAYARTIDEYVRGSLADPDNAAILLFTTFLGGMVGLITKSGGTQGIVNGLKRFATSPRRGQLATWFMGLGIFFDDYANTLIVGPTMRPITDKLKISREKLAYLVDSTAAPVVCLIPISTWVGFEIGLINDAFRNLDLPLDAYPMFLASIPYRYYPLFALLFVFLVAWSGVDFGPMRKAERRARTTGALLPEGATPIANYDSKTLTPDEYMPKRAVNAFAPILTVVVVTILGLWLTGASGATGSSGMVETIRNVLINADSFKALLWASAAGILVALLMPLIQRILDLATAIAAMVEGFKAMLMALLVLVLAWSLGSVCDDLHTAQFLVGIAKDAVSPSLLPVITFVMAAAIAFATGTSWGTMAIIQPLVIPICHNLTTAAGLDPTQPEYIALMSATIASVLTGAVWGDHCSPISDTTILSSMATGCDHIAHVRTQLPYALAIGFVAIFVGILPASHGLIPFIPLGIGALGMIAFMLFIKKQREKSGEAEAS
ncbi:MAG: Na+/H+ antiporter NhaC family protein [Acidobacteriota bacterium]